MFVQLQQCNQPTLSVSHEFRRRLVLRGPCCLQCLCRGARGGTSSYGRAYRAIPHRAGMNIEAHKRHTTRSTKRPTMSTKRPTRSTGPPRRSLKGGSKPPTKKENQAPERMTSVASKKGEPVFRLKGEPVSRDKNTGAGIDVPAVQPLWGRAMWSRCDLEYSEGDHQTRRPTLLAGADENRS